MLLIEYQLRIVTNLISYNRITFWRLIATEKETLLKEYQLGIDTKKITIKKKETLLKRYQLKNSVHNSYIIERRKSYYP